MVIKNICHKPERRFDSSGEEETQIYHLKCDVSRRTERLVMDYIIIIVLQLNIVKKDQHIQYNNTAC